MMQAGGGKKIPLLAVFAEEPFGVELGEEIYDLTQRWGFDRTIRSCHLYGVKKVTLGCNRINKMAGLGNVFPDCEEFHFPYVTTLDNNDRIITRDSVFRNTDIFVFGDTPTTISKVSIIDLPSVESMNCINNNGQGFFAYIRSRCSINLENCSYISCWTESSYPHVFDNTCTGVYQLKLGVLTTATNIFRTPSGSGKNAGFINLVDLRVGQGTAIDLDFHNWPATNVLADPDLTNQLRSNFKNYIIDMVADMSNNTAKTITLSSGVFGAVWTNAPQDYKDSLLASLTAKNWKLTNGTTTIPT